MKTFNFSSYLFMYNIQVHTSYTLCFHKNCNKNV